MANHALRLGRPKSPTRLRDDEIWDLHTHLAALIADSVRRLRDMNHGYPMGLTEEKWAEILTRIADDFQRYYDEDMEGKDAANPNEGFDLIKQWWRGLWD